METKERSEDLTDRLFGSVLTRPLSKEKLNEKLSDLDKEIQRRRRELLNAERNIDNIEKFKLTRLFQH
jgi:hypothetical protein